MEPALQREDNIVDAGAVVGLADLLLHGSNGNNIGTSAPHNTRMELSEEERRWALAIKEAIESDPRLDAVSDFMYVQLALVDSDNLERAIERAIHLQGVRQEYEITDTLEEAERKLRWYVKTAHPGHILDFFHTSEHDHYIIITDISKFDTSAFSTTPKEYNDTFAGNYYLHHCFCPDFGSIRQGTSYVCECSNYRWKAPNMATYKTHKKFTEDGDAVYPYHVRQVQVCNAGVVVNTLASQLKTVLPKQIASKFVFGVHHEYERRLQDICLGPNVEVATERILGAMTKALRERYANEKIFRL